MIIWIVFINWIILEFFIKNFELELANNPHWELFRFYYGKSYFQLWLNKKNLIIFLALELSVNIFNYAILKFYYITDNRLFYVFYYCLVVNTIRVIINYFTIKIRIRNIENNYEN